MFIYRFCLEHARRFKKTFNYSGDVLNKNCAKTLFMDRLWFWCPGCGAGAAAGTPLAMKEPRAVQLIAPSHTQRIYHKSDI